MVKPAQATGQDARLSNHEVVTLAVYLLGGDSQYIDTEDVAVKANEIAPGRYTWRKYPDQINIENLRAFMSDAKKEKTGGYLLGSGTKGWMLTPAGLAFAKANAARVSDALDPEVRLTSQERRWRSRERGRVSTSTAFAKLSEGRGDDVTRQDAEAVFRINDYIVGAARAAKITKLLNALGEDPEVGPAVKWLADLLSKDDAR